MVAVSWGSEADVSTVPGLYTVSNDLNDRLL